MSLRQHWQDREKKGRGEEFRVVEDIADPTMKLCFVFGPQVSIFSIVLFYSTYDYLQAFGNLSLPPFPPSTNTLSMCWCSRSISSYAHLMCLHNKIDIVFATTGEL